MTLTLAITLFGMVLTCITALMVAYLHRKQMRQIELYKNDPSVGLISPPSWLTRFVKSKLDFIFMFGAPLLSLVLIMFSSQPVTRWTVLLISLNVAVILFNLLGLIFVRIANRFMDLMMDLHALQKKQIDVAEKTVSLIGLAVGVDVDIPEN